MQDSKTSLLATCCVCLFTFGTYIETVKSNHVIRFEMDLKCCVFCLQN